MNCTEANKINIAGFLMSKGIHPAKAQGNSFWYCSPLRNEKEPSFKVDRTRNLWFDFGTNTGGGLIDLVCKRYNVNVPGALLILSGARVEHHTSFVTDSSFDRQKEIKKESGIEICKLQPLQNRALISYLTGRKIKPAFASAYCREGYYKLCGN
jgi:DNA primase